MSAAPTFHESAATAEAAQAGLLYERYAQQIKSFCRARLRSPEEAEDAVQHTFLNAYRSLRQGTVPRAEAAWVYAIAANVCRERQRSAWRRSRLEVVSDDGLVAEQAAPEQAEDLGGIADALGELTPNQRRAILLREWQGLSYREIAGELGVSEAAVETLLFRARRSLARMRGRVWGLSNVGSVLAWARAGLPGGAAAPVAAATLAVTAGVTAAVPLLRDTPARPAPAPARVSHVAQTPPVSFAPRHAATAVPAKPSAPQQHQRAHAAAPRSLPRTSATPTTPVTPPTESPPAAAPPAATPPVTVAPPAPAPAPSAPPAPQVPPVEVPPVKVPPLPPPLPLPTPPPLEPVNVPLPSGGVQLPPPPPLP